jgi:hypothetical protein
MLNFKDYLIESEIEEQKFLLACDLYEFLYKNNLLTEETPIIKDPIIEDDEEEDDEEDVDDKDEEDDEEDLKSKTLKNPIKKDEKEKKEPKLFTKPVEEKDKDAGEQSDEQKADVWFKQLMSNIKKPNQASAQSLKNYKKTKTVTTGRIFAFAYDPLHKKKLSFYDTKPLVIPFELKQTKNGGGFLGINLHFLPRQQRAPVIKYFMSKNKVKTMKQGDMDVDYLQDIKHNTKFQLLYYCIRHYLYKQVLSDFFAVPQEEYVNVLNLYSAKYVGMTEYQLINTLKNQKSKNILQTPGIQRVKQKKELANQKRKEQMRAKAKEKSINIVNKPTEKKQIIGNL